MRQQASVVAVGILTTFAIVVSLPNEARSSDPPNAVPMHSNYFKTDKAKPDSDFYGTLPQWLTFLGIVLGGALTARQLIHHAKVRRTENFISIIGQTSEHNAKLLEDKRTRAAIADIEKLSAPQGDEQNDHYWATRLVHLKHLTMIWRVWELAGKGIGKPENDGWLKFTRHIVVRPLVSAARAVADGATGPSDLAGSDIWYALDEYEIFPSKFVKWLKSLAQG